VSVYCQIAGRSVRILDAVVGVVSSRRIGN
jgi:hypothetical protein